MCRRSSERFNREEKEVPGKRWPPDWSEELRPPEGQTFQWDRQVGHLRLSGSKEALPQSGPPPRVLKHWVGRAQCSAIWYESINNQYRERGYIYSLLFIGCLVQLVLTILLQVETCPKKQIQSLSAGRPGSYRRGQGEEYPCHVGWWPEEAQQGQEEGQEAVQKLRRLPVLWHPHQADPSTARTWTKQGQSLSQLES